MTYKFLKRFKVYLSKHIWFVPIFSGLVLRLLEISRFSIWHDEGFTMWLIRYNPIEIIIRTARDVHPPAYYLIAKLWTSIFGSSEFSIRFLSLVFSIGIIFLVYKITELIWNKRAAFWSSMIVAFSPFMLRFGLEARMYGVMAFFTTLAVYYFVRYIKDKNAKFLVYFVPAMIVAMYTQYYSFFALVSLWLILAIYTPGFFNLKWGRAWKQSLGIFDRKWWVANASILLLYLPWFHVAYEQFTRVSASYWIRPEWINERSMPSTILQFITYTHLDDIYHGMSIGHVLYWIIVSLFIFSGLMLLVIKEKRKVIYSLFIYGYLPMILVFVLSKLKTPVYQDRYFSFSAIGVFIISGCTVAVIRNRYVRVFAGLSLLALLSWGILNMEKDVNYPMRQVRDQIVATRHRGDVVVSGSLYTFLDGSYYFGYGNIRYISNKENGYGESALFYDQADKYLVKSSSMDHLGNRIWVIGRPGEEYLKKTTISTWHQEQIIEKGNVRAVLYSK